MIQMDTHNDQQVYHDEHKVFEVMNLILCEQHKK